MTLISLVCLLALSGSALSLPAYGGYGSTVVRPLPLPEMPTPVITEPVVETKVISTGGYGSSLLPSPVVKTFSGYGGSSLIRTLEPTMPVLPTPEIFSRADILCRGQRPETVIPIDNNRKFVVCLDDGKGTEQECPFGLWFHEGTQRCERKLGPSENYCLSSPCFNGGNCIPTDSWFRCECAPGFDGETCELDARICQTQRPCGEGVCQSFRFGAALPYICIFDGGLRYGPNPSTTFQSVCDEMSGPGPHPLSYTRGGFMMCNGPLTHYESCPGGTEWDVLPRACAWPDMVIEKPTTRIFVGERSGYGGERIISTPKVLPTFGGYGAEKIFVPKVLPTPRILDSYGGERILTPKLITPVVGGYGEKVLPKVFDSYGGEKVILPKVDSYGEKVMLPKVVSGYGEKTFIPRPRLVDSYGGERILTPKVITPVVGGYGEKVLTKVIDPVLPIKPVDSYGGESLVLH